MIGLCMQASYEEHKDPNLQAVFGRCILANENACIVHQDIQRLVALLIFFDKLLDRPEPY